jgi:hypothetical protein
LLSAALCKNLLVVLERTSFNTRQKASFAVLTFLFGEGGWAVFLMKDSGNPGGVCNNSCATRDSMAVFPKLFREITE